MAKIKRINLIAKGKQVLSELFNIKVRRINRTLASALDAAEENMVSAEESMVEALNKLGEAETDEARTYALNNILELMDEADQWKLRKKQIAKIQQMLEEEVEETEE